MKLFYEKSINKKYNLVEMFHILNRELFDWVRAFGKGIAFLGLFG